MEPPPLQIRRTRVRFPEGDAASFEAPSGFFRRHALATGPESGCRCVRGLRGVGAPCESCAVTYDPVDFLRHVQEQGDTTITSFSNHEGADHNVSAEYWQLVDGLLEAGLIQGSASGGMGTRRPSRVQLTDHGRETLRRQL